MDIVVELLASSVLFGLGQITLWRTAQASSGKLYGYRTDGTPLEQQGVASGALVGKLGSLLVSILGRTLCSASSSSDETMV